jgi:hypothetical protein
MSYDGIKSTCVGLTESEASHARLLYSRPSGTTLPDTNPSSLVW